MKDVSDIDQRIADKINNKTKPLGALGKLEKIAFQIAKIQNTENPQLISPHILVFAADHGISASGVSAYPPDVTWQMVYNFIAGGAAINVFSMQNDIALKVIDAGVNKTFRYSDTFIDAKINRGTKNFLYEPAMSKEELLLCGEKAALIVQSVIEDTQCNVFGFGEMGIGNTSAAALIMHCLTGIPLQLCVGRGTGLDDQQLENKLNILSKALENNKVDIYNVEEVVQTFGGFEIAMMAEGMLEAYRNGGIILIDGFITTVSFLIAWRKDQRITHHAIFCHQSDESGHSLLLQFMMAEPLLKLDLRLGEGTGCAIAYPIVKSSIAFLNQMASFESANVSR